VIQAFIKAAARDAGLPFKATAGLHHPLRGEYPRPAAGVAVVVDEIERALAELQHRDVGRSADVERAPVVEDRKDA